jgi:Ran GTPase-activating protein (RanGAP) involved in mRNA processing and transport
MDSDDDSSMHDVPFIEEEEEEEDWFDGYLQSVRENNPLSKTLSLNGQYHERVRNMVDDDWEELGFDITNNNHMESLDLYDGALNDHKMIFFFKKLTRSSSVKNLSLKDNRLSVDGVRSMVPFLQNANNLESLNLDDNNMKSKGFTCLVRSLRGSHIERLCCNSNGINSIDIDNTQFPKHLTYLSLSRNSINADGCRGLVRLLQGGGATLSMLRLSHNKINDVGVKILADALQSNTSLKTLDLKENDISDQGKLSLLRLVNDISSIEATLQSNHTLRYVGLGGVLDPVSEIQIKIDVATRINRNRHQREAGREKVIQTQLHSETRAELCRLQGVDHFVFNEIDPLHLPDVLALISHHHGYGELYDALSSSMMILFSTVNVKKCIQQERDYHAAKVAEHIAKAEQLDAKLASMEEAVEGNESNSDVVNRSSKRRRKWLWRLLDGV